MALIPSICNHAFAALGDLSGPSYPYTGAERVCVDCGTVEVCYEYPAVPGRGSRVWVPKGFTPFLMMRHDQEAAPEPQEAA